MDTNKRKAQVIFDTLRDAFGMMTDLSVEGSRELSISITKLEESMMWFNKHRANEGYLGQLDTHV